MASEGRQEGGSGKVSMRQSEEREVTEVPGGAKQVADAPINKWKWVEATVWTDRMLAALDNGVKGNKWFSLIDKVHRPATLKSAWSRVKANRGAAGVDGQSIVKFAAREEVYLGELETAIRDGSYRPQPVKRVEIAKADGKLRPLGIPTVKDRVAQMAVKLVIEPIYENRFLDTSYGFRPGRACRDALREVDRQLKDGNVWVVDADLKAYFDSIPHDRLMARVEEQISDGRIVSLIENFLKQDIMKELERWTPTGGTPQGGVISPLLANLYLHPLDEKMRTLGYNMVRYADDFVILSPTQVQAERALEEVRAWVKENGLTLHPDKTRLGNCMEKGQGFEFLGYRFECGQRHVRKKSLKALYDKIREKTRRTNGCSLKWIVEGLSPTLRGWFNYFRHAQSHTFGGIDGFTRRRMRAILRKREKRPGFGRTHDDHRRWPNAYFAALGLFTMKEAYAQASQSR